MSIYRMIFKKGLIIMKVYFNKKTKEVIKVTSERDSTPYCNTEEYRKNLSELNAEETRSYNDYLIVK